VADSKITSQWLNATVPAEAGDGNRLGEAFAEAGSGVGVDPLELGGEDAQGGLGLAGVRVGPRRAELAAHPGTFGFGQMIENISLLVEVMRISA
jgi:hypothetical protein